VQLAVAVNTWDPPVERLASTGVIETDASATDEDGFTVKEVIAVALREAVSLAYTLMVNNPEVLGVQSREEMSDGAQPGGRPA
jgi:hypothetical protein